MRVSSCHPDNNKFNESWNTKSNVCSGNGTARVTLHLPLEIHPTVTRLRTRTRLLTVYENCNESLANLNGHVRGKSEICKFEHLIIMTEYNQK